MGSFGGLPDHRRHIDLIDLVEGGDGGVVTRERPVQMASLLAVGEIGYRRIGARAIAPSTHRLALGAGAFHGDAVYRGEKFLLVALEIARLVIQRLSDADSGTGRRGRQWA